MERKLDEVLEDQLVIRVYISQTLKAFSLRDITDGWAISLSTLHRYSSPKYRELSRQHARKAYMAYKNEDRTKCATCKESLFGHRRCGDCTILLHDQYERKFCNSCIDFRYRQRMKIYGIPIESADSEVW